MIDVIFKCDFCGIEIRPKKEDTIKSFLFESKTKQIDTRNFQVCELCALKIDNAILEFKQSILEEAYSNSKAQQKKGKSVLKNKRNNL